VARILDDADLGQVAYLTRSTSRSLTLAAFVDVGHDVDVDVDHDVDVDVDHDVDVDVAVDVDRPR